MKNLRKLIKEKGLSQSALGEEFNCAQNAIAEYEGGNRGCTVLNILIRAAMFFNVSTDYILGISPVRRPLSPDEAALAQRIMNFQDPEITEAALKLIDRLEAKCNNNN